MQWRPDAGRLVTLMAIGFGMTVVITRLYLMASGYPKIGGSTYHIAHALFGGLLLVISCVLQLMSSGRTAIVWAAILAGVGLGLFIDEVGKFITADNDYFFPLAAPIIYLAFLIVVAAARYAASRRLRSADLMLGALTEEVGDMVGARMTSRRRETLLAELDRVRVDRLGEPGRDLAAALRTYLHAVPCDPEPPVTARVLRFARGAERRLLPLPLVRMLLVAVLLGHGLWTLLRLVMAVVVISGWSSPWSELDHMLDVTDGHGWKALSGLGIAAVAEAVVGIGCVAGAVVWLRGDEERGVRLGIWTSVVSLTVVNVFASYFSQFLTVFTAIAEAVLLWALLRYRDRSGDETGERHDTNTDTAADADTHAAADADRAADADAPREAAAVSETVTG
ncbi:putative membrane protein [Nocardia nova SH22a]|uniref:Putative membrane protein n=2 Tax=Nocardia nova TaxID=37330 RepID=W5TNG4_9NOCA|nr:putative membrane protein [Nocardia nova SH22a]